jgi:hypothetical protein
VFVFGQTSIEGTFKYKKGNTLITLTSDFHYFYEAGNCFGKEIDSGTYIVRNDTISFHSNLSKKDISNNYFISDESSTSNTNRFIDTFYFSITNWGPRSISHMIDLRLNDSLLLHLDSLQHGTCKQFKYALFQNSSNHILKISVDGRDETVPLVTDVNIIIRENSISLSALKDKYVIRKNKIYSLNMLRAFNKRFYLHKL